MGCCQSTKKPSPQFHQQKSPPVEEEETVKEVLSETPTNPKHFTKNIQHQPKILQKNYNNNEDVVSVSGEVSEICSNMSETISTTKFEEDVEGFRRRVTPASLRNRQQQISPVRGKQQSPGRVRSLSETNNRGSGFGSNGRQRPMSATREVSRSISPANRTAGRGGGGGRNGIGKSPSARKMDNSPGRVRSRVPPEMRQKPELSPGTENSNYGCPLEVIDNEDESIDNPLVSLECFIFL